MPPSAHAKCSYSGMGRSGRGASRCGRPSPERASGPPRVEHLAAAAALSAKIRINSSGVARVKLPENFDGVALVMLSSDWSCEWRILNPKMSSSEPPSSLLQRQLCLAQSFSPQSHMALQASFCCVQNYWFRVLTVIWQPSCRILQPGEEMMILDSIGGVYTR